MPGFRLIRYVRAQACAHRWESMAAADTSGSHRLGNALLGGPLAVAHYVTYGFIVAVLAMAPGHFYPGGIYAVPMWVWCVPLVVGAVAGVVEAFLLTFATPERFEARRRAAVLAAAHAGLIRRFSSDDSVSPPKIFDVDLDTAAQRLRTAAAHLPRAERRRVLTAAGQLLERFDAEVEAAVAAGELALVPGYHATQVVVGPAHEEADGTHARLFEHATGVHAELERLAGALLAVAAC